MNNKGFTLIEALIGIVVLAVLMLGLTSVFDETLKKKKKLKEKSLFDNSFKGFGQQFQYLLKGADVATSFQMLPVKFKSCKSDGPCFFSMDNKGRRSDLKRSHLGGLRGLNFFKDTGIKVYERPLFRKNNAARQIYFKKPRYPAEVKRSKGMRHFVGWKLKSIGKFPFTMLSRSDFPGYFEFPAGLGTSSPSSDYIILKGSQKGLPVGSIIGQLMVFYNAYNSKAYFFKQVEKAGVCTLTNVCNTIAPETWLDKPKLNSGIYYYLKLQRPSNLKEFTASTGVNMIGKWYGQNRDGYSFPYERPSISDPSDLAKDLEKSDPRTFQHYGTQMKISTQIIGVPVSFKKIYLVKQSSKKKKLIMTTFENPKRHKTILNDLDNEAEIFFSRQLSTNKMSAFVVDPPKKKKK